MKFPSEMVDLVSMINMSDFFLLTELPFIVVRKIAQQPHFLQYTNVRRIVIIYL